MSRLHPRNSQRHSPIGTEGRRGTGAVSRPTRIGCPGNDQHGEGGSGLAGRVGDTVWGGKGRRRARANEGNHWSRVGGTQASAENNGGAARRHMDSSQGLATFGMKEGRERNNQGDRWVLLCPPREERADVFKAHDGLKSGQRPAGRLSLGRRAVSAGERCPHVTRAVRGKSFGAGSRPRQDRGGADLPGEDEGRNGSGSHPTAPGASGRVQAVADGPGAPHTPCAVGGARRVAVPSLSSACASG